MFEILFGGIRLRGHQVLALELGLAVEGQAAVADDVVGVAAVHRKRFDRTGHLVLGDGHVGQADAEEVTAGDVDIEGMAGGRGLPVPVHTGSVLGQGNVEAVVANRHQVFGDELALQVDRIAFAVDGQQRILRQVAPLDADARTVQRDVLLAQAVAGEHVVHQALVLRLFGGQRGAQRFLGGLAQDLAAAFGILRAHQLDFARPGFVVIAFGVVGAQHVHQLVAGAVAVAALGQLAVPFGAGDVAHLQGQGQQRRDQVGVGVAVDRQLVALDERGVVAAHEELHRPGDGAAVERHHRRRRHGQFGDADGRILGGPDHAAVGQAQREVALGHGPARRLQVHVHAAVRLQRRAALGTGRSDRIALAAGLQLEQDLALVAAGGFIAVRRGRGCGGFLRLLCGDQRGAAQQQADQGAVQQFHLHLHGPPPHCPAVPAGAVGSLLDCTRTFARSSGGSCAAMAS